LRSKKEAALAASLAKKQEKPASLIEEYDEDIMF
jgi:hypothetical protein